MEKGDYAAWREDLAETLQQLRTARMPFGKYGPKECPPNGKLLIELPLEYLLWFQTKGFPKGKLGNLLQSVCAIKSSGAEEILWELKKQ